MHDRSVYESPDQTKLAEESVPENHFVIESFRLFGNQGKSEEEDYEIDDELGHENFFLHERFLDGQLGDQLNERADHHEHQAYGAVVDERVDEEDTVQNLHDGQLDEKVFGEVHVPSIIHAQLVVLAVQDVLAARSDYRVEVDQQLDEEKHDANAFGKIVAGLIHFGFSCSGIIDSPVDLRVSS